MRKAPLIKDGLVVLALISLVAAPSHLYITDQKKFLQLIYPAESLVARFKTTCSQQTPRWLANAIKKSSIFSPAGQLAYVDQSGVLHHCEMGWQGQVLVSEPVEADSYFRFASLTKVITSLAYAKLEQNAEINDDQPLLAFFPSERTPVDARLAEIRLANLHQHTAGYDRLITPDPMFIFKKRSWCPSDIGRLYQLKLDFTPGERASYSNLSYCLLGEIIGEARNSDYQTALNELLNFSDYDLDFFSGPYLPREVQYDFRNTGFYGENYYQYFNYDDSIAAISLVGTAKAYAQLVHDHKDLLQSLFSIDWDAVDCDLEKLRTCYHYSMEPMRKGKDGLLVFSHSGYLWGSTAFMMLDEHGGVFVWVGKGSPKAGSSDFDDLKWNFYDMLSAHYQ